MKKYPASLKVLNDKIFSYEMKVAEIDHEKKQVIVLGWWSATTSKHINLVAENLNYETIKSKDYRKHSIK